MRFGAIGPTSACCQLPRPMQQLKQLLLMPNPSRGCSCGSRRGTRTLPLSLLLKLLLLLSSIMKLQRRSLLLLLLLLFRQTRLVPMRMIIPLHIPTIHLLKRRQRRIKITIERRRRQRNMRGPISPQHRRRRRVWGRNRRRRSRARSISQAMSRAGDRDARRVTAISLPRIGSAGRRSSSEFNTRQRRMKRRRLVQQHSLVPLMRLKLSYQHRTRHAPVAAHGRRGLGRRSRGFRMKPHPLRRC